MSRTILIAFVFFVSELWSFDCFMLILCNLHSCTLHNSLTIHDIFMQFYRNVFYVKTMCLSRARIIVPFFMGFKLCPFNNCFSEK